MATKPLSKNLCAAEGCTERTGFKRDGSPAKYGVKCGHQAAARQGFKAMLAEQAAEKEALYSVFRTLHVQAMDQAREAAEAAPVSSPAVSKVVIFAPNRKFSNFLVKENLGESTPAGVVVRFPALSGAREAAQAYWEGLAVFTSTGQPLQGQRITVR
jgi:hypothetical protein